MGDFIMDQLGRLLIGSTFIGFGYAWGTGAIEAGTWSWVLWLFATTLPAAFGTTMIKAAERPR